MVEQPLIVKIGMWLYSLLPAILKFLAGLCVLLPSIFGSVISLRFSTENMSTANKILSVLSGVTISHYFTHTIVEIFKINPESFLVSGLLFVSGLFGFAVMAEIYKQLPQLVSSLMQKLLNFLK